METYDIATGWKDLSTGEQERAINRASMEELEKWASDPCCNQRSFVSTRLEWMRKGYVKPLGIDTGGPFSPRVDISADARYISGRIVKHLWIIFVALPFVLAVLFVILKN
ncbi:MAG TPA: hypothetical protein VIG25_03115 [Pyrinomonadaceae bacterium]|jgi:hypothetical protein